MKSTSCSVKKLLRILYLFVFLLRHLHHLSRLNCTIDEGKILVQGKIGRWLRREESSIHYITKESPSYLVTSTRPIKMCTVLYIEWNGSHDTLCVALYGNVLLGWNFTCLQLLVYALIRSNMSLVESRS